MTYFLRNGLNESIVDLDFTKDDFHVVVCIASYSDFLLSLRSGANRGEFISDMDALQELRGEWWESPIGPRSMDMHEFCKSRMLGVARRWGLSFVVD